MIQGFKMTIDDYLNIVELAKSHGKKEGDSMEDEMKEYIKNKTHIQKVESTDEDLLKGNLREEGFYKILDLRNTKENNQNGKD